MSRGAWPQCCVVVMLMATGMSACGKKRSDDASPVTPASSLAASRTVEAEQMLGLIGVAAKTEFNTNAAYPAGTAELTPGTPCCEQPGKRCQPSAADWAVATWQSLSFQMTDGPFDFQYSYAASAADSTFIAHAIGDPGCTGHPVKVTLSGSLNQGTPVITLSHER